MPDQPPRYAYVLAPTKRVSTRRSNCRPSQLHPKVLLRQPIRRLDGDGPGVEASGDTMQITSPDEAAALIDQLRTAGITLTYDPDTRTIRTGDRAIAAVTVGRDR